MEISNSPLEWSSDDTATLREFFLTKTGQRLLPKIVESAPTLFATGDTNTILIRNGENIGFQKAVRAFLDLAYPPPEIKTSTVENYPDLFNDAAHNDGQKLNPE
jgi:hypothetical protein